MASKQKAPVQKAPSGNQKASSSNQQATSSNQKATSSNQKTSTTTSSSDVGVPDAKFATVQDILEYLLPGRFYHAHWKPTWLKNTVVKRTRPNGDVDSPTGRQLSVSFYYPEFKFGMCSASGSGKWFRSDPNTDKYYAAVDKFKIDECRKQGIELLIMPAWVDMEDAKVRLVDFITRDLEIDKLPLDRSLNFGDGNEDESDGSDDSQGREGYGSS